MSLTKIPIDPEVDFPYHSNLNSSSNVEEEGFERKTRSNRTRDRLKPNKLMKMSSLEIEVTQIIDQESEPDEIIIEEISTVNKDP